MSSRDEYHELGSESSPASSTHEAPVAVAAPAPAAAPEADAKPATGPAAYAAELQMIEAEKAALAAEEGTLEERLQLYSEVQGLQRELQVVQEDEHRLRKQLADTEKSVGALDPQVAREVAMLEDEAQHSALHALWEAEAVCHSPERADWSTVNVSHLRERVEAARRKFNAANAKAEEIYAQQEDAVNAHTDNRERTKASLKESYDEEMANLKDTRARLKQVEAEQAFHYKRGTTRRTRQPPVSQEKLVVSRQRRIDDAEARTTQQVDKMNDELAELMEQCKVLKKQLDDNHKESEKRQGELKTVLKGVEEEGSEAKEFKEKLEKEKSDLDSVKADLQGVLHYVRAKKREEDDF